VIEALVFDFDGLIFDTEVPGYTAWNEAFVAHGCGTLAIEEWSQEVGTIGALDLVGMMRARATEPFDEEAMQVRRRARRDELLAGAPVMPGVDSWLDDAEKLGLRLAIASSSEIEWVEDHLGRLGLRTRFEHLSCADDVLAYKPEPDTYLAACDALGVAPTNAIAVEDSPHGARAAKSAGLRCVAVPNAVTMMLDLSHADLVLSSLAQMTLPEAIAALDG
jgi:HAD superfamily hydrolase (TIGR01509 family)